MYKSANLHKILVILLSILLISSLSYGEEQAKNIILLVGDGMGFSHIAIGKYYLEGQKLNMENMGTTGFCTTHSENSYVTCSAASATAFSSGYKTKNGMLGWLPDNITPKTVLEGAAEKGKKVGLVSTCRVTHATPAAFAAHVIHRDKENEIAEQMVRLGVDVILGGGLRFFIPKEAGGKRVDGIDLTKAATEMGYQFVQNRDELMSTKSDKILGLFTNSHMNYELDRNKEVEPSLAEMTEKALEVLSQDEDGFFVMIEGGRIDHAGHRSDVGGVVNDLLAFDKAIEVALNFAEKDTNTLVIVTADHECGGLGLGNGRYEIKPELIRNIKHSVEFAVNEVETDSTDINIIMTEYFGISDLTEKELENIQSAPTPLIKMFAMSKAISDRVMVGWTSTKHTATMVPVMAHGPGAENFEGFMDNTDIPKKISAVGNYEVFKE